MKSYIVAPQAEEDIFEIWQYLHSESGPALADRIEAELLDSFPITAGTPGRGHRRPDLTSANVLFYAVFQYLVVYRLERQLEILAVLHGKRDVARLLAERL